MNLNLAKNVKSAIEVNGEKFIELENSIVYECFEDNMFYLFIKEKDSEKQLKIRFVKE
jgi:hypothetical protein